jgi:glycosyltransferase involved in cell wall biosynthesis
VVQSARVTIVTSRLDIGGAERHLARVVPALKERGIDIAVYTMERGGSLETELQQRGVRIEGPRRTSLLHWPRATLALARFLRRERPSVVHFFLPRPYLYGSIAAELAGHRRRLLSRRSLTFYRDKYPLLRSFERLLHSRTFGLIGNSRAVFDQLATEVADPRKLALIHNGIDIPPPITAAERQDLRQRLRVPDDAVVIFIIANLIAYKGYRDLIDALALVKDRLLQPWVVLAIGRDDGIGDELQRQARAFNIEGNIRWLGQQPAAERLLYAGDIFVLPSHQEGFSNALLEAMAAGLAVIASAIGGNLDAIVDNESGLLVPPRDPPELAAALARLSSDPDLRRRLGAAARRRVEQRFTLQNCVDRYEKLYRAMVGSSPPPLAEILSDDTATAMGRPLIREYAT